MRRVFDLLFFATLAFISLGLAETAGPVPARVAGGPGKIVSPARPEPEARDWKRVAKRVFVSISEDRLLANAAAVTFYGLLAMFPALATLISLYGLVADPHTIQNQLATMRGVMPGGGMQIISDQVHSLISAPTKALGFGAVFGILVAFWSANSGMKAMFDALNAAFEAKEKRSFVKLTLVTMAFTIGGLVLVVLAIAAFVAVPAIIHFIGLGPTGDLLISLLRWPVLLVVVALALAFLYRYGPDRPGARWRWISWGNGLATVLWLLASAGFSYYVANFGSYNKTYGSLGAAVGFMTWIWISTIILLIGAELNAELQKTTPNR